MLARSHCHLCRDCAEPATRDGKREARALGQQVKESEAFLRRRGSEAPAVVALSFLSAAAAALAPLVMVRALPQAHLLGRVEISVCMLCCNKGLRCFHE